MLRGVSYVNLFFIFFSIFPQQLSHEVRVVNIAVPVRVYDGGKFVDSLKLDDFEVYEDGQPQPIQAAYYIQKNDVKRGEAPGRTAAPVASRHFVLLFQMMEYLPELNDAINLFFDEILRNGDSVDLVTPRKTYRLAGSVATEAGRRKAKQEFISKVRQDILIDSGAYNSIIRDMVHNLEAIQDAQLDERSDRTLQLNAYRDNFQRLEALQAIDLTKMSAFAAELKKSPGAKHVFLFFQQDRVPQFSTRALMDFVSHASPEEVLKVQELMSQVRRDVPIDREAIEKAFADASVDVHFLYITRTRKDIGLDVDRQTANETAVMAPRTGDIYNAFRDIAAATGGTADSSWNPAELLKKAAAASEQYYLLYYRPRGYSDDGKFHEIKVKVKNRNYRISHRAGYFAKDVPVEPPPAPEPESEKPASKSKAKESPPPDPAQTAEMTAVLAKSAAYCRKLENAALNFVCNETVVELFLDAGIPIGGSIENIDNGSPISLMNFKRAHKDGRRSSEWTYDFQLIRKDGTTQERRTLVRENGEKRQEVNAELKTTRFIHRNVLLGPIGLLSEKAQLRHTYRFVKEDRMDGDTIVVIEATPREKTGASLFGKAWIRKRDGAVVRIEWEPSSMENYAAIEEFALQVHVIPKIAFASEYGFEKSGLRFPNVYEVTEAYTGLRTSWKNVLSKTTVTYKDYKFFQVETAVDFR